MFNEEKQIRISQDETILCLLSGLRKNVCKTSEDVAYNNALGDVFDYIIENHPVLSSTKNQGKWVRD